MAITKSERIGNINFALAAEAEKRTEILDSLKNKIMKESKKQRYKICNHSDICEIPSKTARANASNCQTKTIE